MAIFKAWLISVPIALACPHCSSAEVGVVRGPMKMGVNSMGCFTCKKDFSFELMEIRDKSSIVRVKRPIVPREKV